MPSGQYDPTANGTDTAWTAVGGSPDWGVVADSNDSAYLRYASDASGYESVLIANLPADAVEVQSVTYRYRNGRSAAGAGNRGLGHRQGGTRTMIENFTLPWAAAAWADTDKAAATDPTGATWTPALFNSVQIAWGTNSSGTGGVDARMTKVFATVSYTTGAGGFVWLLASFAALALGANLLLSDMPQVADHVARATEAKSHQERRGAFIHPYGLGRQVILPGEYREAWEAWRAYTHPRYFSLDPQA